MEESVGMVRGMSFMERLPFMLPLWELWALSSEQQLYEGSVR